MGLTKPSSVREEKFDLYNSNDRRVIEEFERDLAPYMTMQIVVNKGEEGYEKTLQYFDAYLHAEKIFHYTDTYKNGALVRSRLEDYRLMRLKWDALCRLKDIRKKASEHDEARIDSLLVPAA